MALNLVLENIVSSIDTNLIKLKSSTSQVANIAGSSFSSNMKFTFVTLIAAVLNGRGK